MVQTNWIRVKVYIPSFHFWNKAPDKVKYLRNSHLHTFRFTVWLEVTGLDRQIEFFMFKEYLYELLQPLYLAESSFSCEQLGNQLLEKIKWRYPDRKIKIFVDENDDEGSVLEYEPE